MHEVFSLWRPALLVVMSLFCISAHAGSGTGDSDQETFPNAEYHENGFYVGKSPGSELLVAITDGANPIVAVFDRGTDRVYVSSSSEVVDFSLQQVALAYAGNVEGAQIVMAQIRGFVDGGIAFEQFSNPGDFLADWRPRRPSSDPYPCDVAPCGPYDTDDWLQRQFGTRNWDPSAPSWYVGFYTQREIDADKHNYQVWRNGQCQASEDATRNFLLSTLSAAGTCSTSMTGPILAGCLASLGGMYAAASSGAAKACHSSYPGPGRWGVN